MSLAEEQRIIQHMAREFAESELRPHAREWDREGRIPPDVLERMGELGLMGVCVDEVWGGAGADFMSYILALEEIAAGESGCSTVMSVNNSPVCAAIEKYGSKEQKARFLTPLARGEIIGCFLLTEPQAGSDASNLRTRAVADGNHWVITGNKQFITSGSIAKLAMIFAVSGPDAGKRGISCFLSPLPADGYTVAALEDKLGQRSSDTCHIVLDGLRVSADDMLGAPGDGYKIALANLSTGRIGIAAQAIGMARAAWSQAHAYALERESFGRKIIEHQAVEFRLAEMATEIEAARQLTHHAARLLDAGEASLKQASMAKLFASEMAERVCSAAIQTLGGYGYLADYGVERIYRDVRVTQIYEGTSDVQKLVIGRALRAEG